MTHKKPNRLIKEKSPYLRQHAYNPVDWYPWCEEAFRKAKEEDKPVFLSVGYSTCHWCHVMEKESFEDPEIARILNENFVAIKVDREERPDIDSLYMSVCQMLTGSGGWPLTVLMTPDKEPFFAGTYFPKESHYGRPGLRDILLGVAQLWREDREKVLNSAGRVVSALKESAAQEKSSRLNPQAIEEAFSEFFFSFDREQGGFGHAPKFPVPHNLMFLLRYFYRTKNENALHMATFTLEKMRLGGIWDFVGHGFHRYSTDSMWLLPHFEKMLYDNALLMTAYTEAYQITQNDLFRETAEDIADYLLRDMRSPEGGFYSAEDADSEGEEGKFYTWSLEELRQALTQKELELVVKVFHLKEEGNFLEEATRRKTGRNVLFMAFPLEKHARDLGMEPQELKSRLEEIRNKLFRARERRVRPLKDDKILTDWNALAVVAFSLAGRHLRRDDFVEVARTTADFLLENLYVDGKLLHRYKDSEASLYGLLEDYAYLIWGLLELYQSTFELRYLQAALELLERSLIHFWDEEGGGFFQTPDYGEKLLLRKKETYDGALPSGNGVMAYNLVRLARMLGRKDYEDMAVKTLESFFKDIENYPSAHSFALMALDLLANGSSELVVVAPSGEELWKEDMETLRGKFLPDLTVLKREEDLVKLSLFLKGLKANDSGVAYYLCRGFACQRPTESFEEVLNTLEG